MYELETIRARLACTGHSGMQKTLDAGRGRSGSSRSSSNSPSSLGPETAPDPLGSRKPPWISSYPPPRRAGARRGSPCVRIARCQSFDAASLDQDPLYDLGLICSLEAANWSPLLAGTGHNPFLPQSSWPRRGRHLDPLRDLRRPGVVPGTRRRA
jgi:hypothetical protein